MAEEKHEEEFAPSSPDVHFEPVVKLAPVHIDTMEDDEEEIFKMRSKLFRYAKEAEPAEWKERGTGDVRILKHKSDASRFRLLMRRDKTLKVCANHYITSEMELLPNCGSDRAWVWTVLSDYADEEAKPETLAIRFANSENAQKFKTKFEECQTDIVNNLKNEANETDNKEKETEDVAKQLEDLTVKDSNKEDASESKDNKVEGKTDEKDKKSEDKTEVKTEETKDEPSDDTKEKKDES